MDALAELTVVEDPVFLSWLLACLRQEDIAATVTDRHTSAALGGAVGAIRARVWVPADRLPHARWVLEQAREDPEP
ncbi:DUF2007 domain-containing protein [Roseospira navarrensis]|uniref:DUF2007 domain-containing protein n=1 Tax=Roseospira navarrensis TaxID=140058 RepID=A0A7X1ZCG7_9PROT|nr:DUF2007 domain-containing protein [Roseospira navarrensis]MQX35802.1 DUF2007 domain-containing protein [Roseospira navarrensis]